MLKVDPSQRSMPEIDPAKVCFLIEKSKALLAEDEGAPADASNPSDDGGHDMLTDAAYPSLHREVEEFLEGLDSDEAAAVVALAWIGRGDFEPKDWRAAVSLAEDRREGSTSKYLLGIPLLPDYLEEALSAYGCSCRDYDSSAEAGGD